MILINTTTNVTSYNCTINNISSSIYRASLARSQKKPKARPYRGTVGRVAGRVLCAVRLIKHSKKNVIATAVRRSWRLLFFSGGSMTADSVKKLVPAFLVVQASA